MKTKIDKVIIDADFTLKLGKLNKYKIIEDYLPEYAEQIYIHEHIYRNEILNPPSVRYQIDKLIENGRAIIVNRNYILAENPEAVVIYEDTQDLLSQNIEESVDGHKNWGEIVSIAFANSMGINYFLSWMREAGVERRVIRTAWMFYESQNDVNTIKDIERIKKWFDNEFWQI
jgi:hypothetical protein